jgi:hypothetical protein
MKLSPLHFQLSIFLIQKELSDSLTRRLPDSVTPRLGDSLTRQILHFWDIPAAFNHRFIQKIIALLLKR